MSKKIGYQKISTPPIKNLLSIPIEALYIFSLNYKDSPKNRVSFVNLAISIAYLLPDKKYKQSYIEALTTHSLHTKYFEDPKLLSEWGKRVLLHFLPFSKTQIHTLEKYSQGKLFWGPKVWATLHIFAANYSPSYRNKEYFIKFITSLAYLLPCDECRKHYILNLDKLPLDGKDFESRENLYTWTFRLHSLVNSQLNKPNPNYYESKKLWEI